MNAYWDSLQERERWALVIAAGCCSLFIVYLVLIKPLHAVVERRSQDLTEKRETLAWMLQVQQQHPNHASTAAATGNYLTLISEQLKTSSFRRFPYQFQQTTQGDLELSFDEVPYNDFVNWLWSLNKKYAFSIKLLNAEKTSTPGVVKLRMVLDS